MPRHIIRPSSRSPKHERFIKKLVQELKNPGSSPQPLILEEEIPSTRSRHIHVIWDQFAKLTEEERSAIILDAYAHAEGPAYAEEITITSGLTPREALALGFLPWRIDAQGAQGDRAAEFSKAVEEELPHTILQSDTWMHGLRYARQEDAEAVVRRLRQRAPEIKWRIVRESESDA